MPKYFCPRCGTTLAEDFLVTAGKEFDCPECRQLIRLDVVAPELARAAEDATASSQTADAEPAVEETPPGGRLQCRVVGRQLVLFVPPGSSKEVRAIGCFAFVWLGFMAVFTSAFVSALFRDGIRDIGIIGAVLFVSLFWAIGLGMAYFWYRGRYGKTYVLVERDRLVLRFVLGKREKIKEYVLDENSRADLVVSYEQNERPVYAVRVSTSARAAKFGTFLAQEEKEWLVARINRHLGRNS